MRATHRTSHTVKGWHKRAPKRVGDRRALKARCGAKAFLDPKRLAYPIVAKGSGCAIDCAGLRAAKSRAAQRHKRKLVARANRLASRATCAWHH